MVKYLLGWLVVFAIRLMPFRPANVEPLMATLMPYSKKYGWIGGFVFAFFGIVLFDVATGNVGLWTWITGGVYGLIGTGAYFYFRNRPATAKNFVIFSVLGTLVFDAITGLGIGPIFYGQPFMQALTGQIPFTLRHLLGNVVLALFVAPAIYRWVVENPIFATRLLWNRLAHHATIR
ncbi:MAG: hypothetical protein AAB483_01075 [Patescibacteria group bacterium]